MKKWMEYLQEQAVDRIAEESESITDTGYIRPEENEELVEEIFKELEANWPQEGLLRSLELEVFQD